MLKMEWLLDSVQGSTAYFFVEEIGRRIKEEGLSVVGVTTSSQTTKQAGRFRHSFEGSG